MRGQKRRQPIGKGRKLWPLDDKSLGRDAGLPAASHPGRGRSRTAVAQVRIGQNEKGVRTAKLHDRLLHLRSGQGAHRRTGSGRARDRHPANGRMGHGPRHKRFVQAQHRQRAFREAGFGKQGGQGGHGTAHRGRRLDRHHVAGHQKRRRTTTNLPIRKIPGHDGQNHAEWLIDHETLSGLRRHALLGQPFGRHLGIEATNPGASANLGLGLSANFSHFQTGQSGQTGDGRVEQLGQAAQTLAAHIHGRVAPRRKRPPGGIEQAVTVGRVMAGIGGNDLAGGRIGTDKHRFFEKNTGSRPGKAPTGEYPGERITPRDGAQPGRPSRPGPAMAGFFGISFLPAKAKAGNGNRCPDRSSNPGQPELYEQRQAGCGQKPEQKSAKAAFTDMADTCHAGSHADQ